MKLPEIFEPRRFLDRIPGRRRSALRGAVIHNGHARRDSIQKLRTVAGKGSMVRNDVNIHHSELVLWTYEFHLLVRGQVAQVKNPQFSKSEEYAQRSGIFGAVRPVLPGSAAARILGTATTNRLFNERSIRTDHSHLNPFQR